MTLRTAIEWFFKFGVGLSVILAHGADITSAVIARPVTVPILDQHQEKPWTGQAEFSFLSTQGNTETLSLGVKGSGTRNWTHWALQARGEYLQTRDAIAITAESYLLGSRGTRKFLGFDLFTDFEYQSNQFAGFVDLYKIALGIGREFYKSDAHAIRLEIGPAFVVEKNTGMVVNRFSSIGAQLLHEWTLSTQVKFTDRVSYLGNLERFADSRYELELGLAAPVSQWFSLKAAYLAQYRNLPPIGKKNFDGKTTLSILATF